MKKIVYVAIEVDADSYQEANAKVKHGLSVADRVLSDTILIDSQDITVRKLLASCKIVNHAKL